jgi:hypothetical protein
VPGATIEVVIYDDSTAGRYDPAQAAANAHRMVADRQVVAVVGPQYSDAGKAMTPILSEGGLATITPGASNPDLTDPKFAAQYRRAGKPIFFRMVTTDGIVTLTGFGSRGGAGRDWRHEAPSQPTLPPSYHVFSLSLRDVELLLAERAQPARSAIAS